MHLARAFEFLTTLVVGVLTGFMVRDIWIGGTTLQNWQTLITGGLAVLAAYFTVSQMRRSDERQEIRHADMVALGLRADALRMARATQPTVLELQTLGREILMSAQRFRSVPNADDLGRLYGLMDSLERVVSKNSLTEALDLFGPSQIRMLTYLQELATEWQHAPAFHPVSEAASYKEFLATNPSKHSDPTKQRNRRPGPMYQFETVGEFASMLATDFDRIARRYENAITSLGLK